MFPQSEHMPGPFGEALWMSEADGRHTQQSNCARISKEHTGSTGGQLTVQGCGERQLSW